MQRSDMSFFMRKGELVKNTGTSISRKRNSIAHSNTTRATSKLYTTAKQAAQFPFKGQACFQSRNSKNSMNLSPIRRNITINQNKSIENACSYATNPFPESAASVRRTSLGPSSNASK
jgi:hypothetical protein